MKKLLVITLCFAISLTLFESCGTTKEVESTVIESVCKSNEVVSYTTVKTIIDSECAGCHDQSQAGKIGDFTNYNGLKSYLDNGLFTKLVLEKHLMPKGKELSSTNLDLLKCWKNLGFNE